MYRGNQISGLNGVYFFADYCSGEIGLLSKNENDEWNMSLAFPNINGSWVSFGEDINGELYIASINGGVYKIIDAALSNNEIDVIHLIIFPIHLKIIFKSIQVDQLISNYTIYQEGN